MLPKRVLLKISGESLSNPNDSKINEAHLSRLVSELQALKDKGLEIAVILGGGNIIRGANEEQNRQISRVSADQMGMLATLINGMALSSALNKANISNSLTSTLSCPQIADLYNANKANEALHQRSILICTTGAGTPFLTTDTAAALRACELNVDLLIKATMHVDGIYNEDPLNNPNAIRYDAISYKDYLAQNLEVIDSSAVSLCMNANIPIRVFNFSRYSLYQAITSPELCSIINATGSHYDK